MSDERMVFMHGFSDQEALAIMRAVKGVATDPAGIAFSVSTDNNKSWSVEDLINEVREEHEYMRKNRG